MRSDLTALLKAQGCDKGDWYGPLYQVLLQPVRSAVRCVIEIGVGTMIPGAPSSMVGWAGPGYRPGGSLRAWRDWFPNAEIHGFDIAADTAIADEPRIVTHLCDSTNADAVAAALARIPIAPDLIVDDGLHTLEAQRLTLRHFYPALAPGGLYVVEDVMEPPHRDVLREDAERLRPGSRAFVYETGKVWSAIVVRRPA